MLTIVNKLGETACRVRCFAIFSSVQAFCATDLCDAGLPAHGAADARIMACLVEAKLEAGEEEEEEEKKKRRKIRKRVKRCARMAAEE